jgi:hypothetical protein
VTWTVKIHGDSAPFELHAVPRHQWEILSAEERKSVRFVAVKRVLYTLRKSLFVRRLKYARTRAEPIEKLLLGALGLPRTAENSRLVAQAMADRRFARVNLEGKLWYLGCKVVLPDPENDQ